MSDQFLTPSDFAAWQKVNARMLHDAEERNQRAVDDHVIKSVMRIIQSGLTLNESGDMFLRNPGYGFRDGIQYTPASVRSALKSIGWRSKRERTGGKTE